jgi:hypothetical protein
LILERIDIYVDNLSVWFLQITDFSLTAAHLSISCNSLQLEDKPSFSNNLYNYHIPFLGLTWLSVGFHVSFSCSNNYKKFLLSVCTNSIHSFNANHSQCLFHVCHVSCIVSLSRHSAMCHRSVATVWRSFFAGADESGFLETNCRHFGNMGKNCENALKIVSKVQSQVSPILGFIYYFVAPNLFYVMKRSYFISTLTPRAVSTRAHYTSACCDIAKLPAIID